ncbi:MAG TPA: hypothetical protein VN667_05010 [Burkholderiales bacterium]|nr:hypothetical protein [Burkholderiales bacterium]
MNTSAHVLRPRSPWIWGFSATVALGFTLACLEIFAQTGQNTPASADPAPAGAEPRAAAAPGISMRGARGRCSECGTIVSTQEIDAPGESAGRYAYTVRFRDGSTRMITNAHPVNWREGQRVIIIAGTD